MAEPHILLTVVAGMLGRQPRAQRRLTRRRLADSGRQDAAHDDFVDLGAGHSGIRERRLDGDRAQLRRGDGRESALEGADRVCGAPPK